MIRTVCRPAGALLALALVPLVHPAAGQEKSVRPGINKPFQNPDVRDFVGKFEIESREVFSRRKEIVAACGIKPGMKVADVGAGTGLFTRLFAKEVGPRGKVYAVDITPKFVEHIKKACQEAGLRNVTGVVCEPTSVGLPAGSIDLAFICDTYHHFEFPHRVMASVHKALRPGGRLVLIDFHRVEGKSSKWVLGHVRAGQEVFSREIQAAGFKKVDERKLLKENYFLVFQKIGPGRDGRGMLIEPGELQRTLAAPGLRILDVRPQGDYARGHLPGAVWVDVNEWTRMGKREGGFQDREAWSRAVGRLGVGHDSRVVVCGGSLPDAARVWWTLKYLGLPHVSLLDGGWERWAKERRPTVTAAPKVEPVKFEPRFQIDRLEEIGPLKKAVRSGTARVVDTRSRAEYTGKNGCSKRGGHIPGATHLEWKELLAADGRFQSPEQLRALFRRKGIRPEQTVVTC